MPIYIYACVCVCVRVCACVRVCVCVCACVTLTDKVKKVKSEHIRKELGVNSIQEKVREMRLCWYGHIQRMEESNEVQVIVDMMVPGKRPRGRWIGWRPRGHAGTADHPRGCPGQNILEIINSGR